MFRASMICTLAGLLALANTSLADERVSVGSLRAQVKAEHITTLVSRQGEEKIAFLQRLGGLMEAYTARTGFEACGTVFEGNGRVGVVVTSSLARARCATTDKSPGMGMVQTNDSIHTHPQDKVIVFNENDAVFSGFRERRHARKRVDPLVFSPTDYDGGSGYLVTGRQLLYQNGRGTERTLGAVAPADPEVVNSILAGR